MSESTTEALIVQLLEWLSARPRSYGETMDAWRTSCPRLPVWEEAVAGGLVETAAGGGAFLARTVHLTEAGRRRLATR